MKSSETRPIRIIFRKEIQEILRDKKIIILTVVIPILIFPLVFFGIDKLFTIQKEKIEKEGVLLSVTGDSKYLNPYINSDEFRYTIKSFPSPDIGISRGNADIAVEIVEPTEKRQLQYWIYYFSSKEKSLFAFNDFIKQIEESKYQWFRDRIEERNGPEETLTSFEVTIQDVSSQESKSGHFIGKILPFILVTMLISGCSFTAIDLIAGEKERGCFETLLVTSAKRIDIIIGKFFVVFTTGLVSVILNLLGMLLALKLGFTGGGEKFDFSFHITLSTLWGILLSVIPLCILFSALLMAFSAKARSFQEGQVYLLPFTLLSMIPALASTLPGMHSDSYLVIVPIANISVAIREFMEGSVKMPFLVLANIINLAYAAIALRWAVRFMNTEGSLVVSETGKTTFQKHTRATLRSGIITFTAVWLLMYFIAAPIQNWNLQFGLIFTLYVIILGAALIHVRVLKLPFTETLSIRKTNWINWGIVLPFTLGALCLVQWLLEWQMRVLPFPQSLTENFKDVFFNHELNIPASIFLFGISPGICEELLFRGALQGTFALSTTKGRAVILAGLLFGFLHFSVYRFLPTTLLGIGFGYLVIRCHSIFPAMLSHALNNIIAIHIVPIWLPEDFNFNWYLLGIPLLFCSVVFLEFQRKANIRVKKNNFIGG